MSDVYSAWLKKERRESSGSAPVPTGRFSRSRSISNQTLSFSILWICSVWILILWWTFVFFDDVFLYVKSMVLFVIQFIPQLGDLTEYHESQRHFYDTQYLFASWQQYCSVVFYKLPFDVCLILLLIFTFTYALQNIFYVYQTAITLKPQSASNSDYLVSVGLVRVWCVYIYAAYSFILI